MSLPKLRCAWGGVSLMVFAWLLAAQIPDKCYFKTFCGGSNRFCKFQKA